MLNQNDTQQLWNFSTPTLTVKNPTILLVDDSESVWFSIKRIFKGFPGKLLFAQDGAEGLKLYRKYKPMLTFLDLRMPILNGIDFLKQAESGFEKEQVIAILTGHGDDQEIQRCFNLGASYFISKPFNIHQIRGISISVIRQIQALQQQKGEEEVLHRKQLTAAYQNGLNEQNSLLLHNINNSLMPAVLYLDSVKKQSQKMSELSAVLHQLQSTDESSFRDTLEQLQQSKNRMNHLASIIIQSIEHTEQVLRSHREHLNKKKQSSKDFAPEDIINEAVSLTGALAKKYNITIDLDIDEELGQVHLPQDEFLQMMNNLLKNSIEAIIERSRRENVNGIISIQILPSSDKRFIIQISDNGCGIPLEHQSRLFQENFSTKSQGQGYGLSSTLLFLESIDGSITVNSKGIHQGSKFTIELPTFYELNPFES